MSLACCSGFNFGVAQTHYYFPARSGRCGPGACADLCVRLRARACADVCVRLRARACAGVCVRLRARACADACVRLRARACADVCSRFDAGFDPPSAS